MSKQDSLSTARAQDVPSVPVSSAQSLPFEPTVEPTATPPSPVGGLPVSPVSGLVLNERYVIECELGRGGMSRVFAARDIKLDRRVAIKFLNPGVHDDDELRRFEQEARAAGSLNHPNVLTVHDVGKHEGNPYIVSELLEGGTLREQLEGATFTVEESIDYAEQMADGLAAAHDKGIVHRDLKPENLFITSDGRLKILDFGIAKLVTREPSRVELKSPAQTQTGTILGTMGYMSPEQVRGEQADHRSDIFSAGTILYEMLSGKRAFKASSSVETAYAILNAKPPELPERVPDDLQAVLWHCLEKKPEERFQSARELGLRLRGLSTAVSSEGETRESSESRNRALQIAAPTTRRFAATVAVVLVIAFLLAVGLGRWRKRLSGIVRTPVPSAVEGTEVPAGVNQARRSVAVLGFKNLSGRPEEAWFSTALSEMLTTELAAGEKVRTIPGERVSQVRTELALADAEALAKETLFRLRKNLFADLVVLGSYVNLGKEAGGQMRLDVRLQDAVVGETISLFSETGTEKDLFGLVSRTGAKLRKKLGIGELSSSEAEVVKASLPSNVEAARLYSEGLAKVRASDPIGGRDLLQKAILVDPNHALSHQALSDVLGGLGYEAKARDEAKKALDLSANLSREERLTVEAQYYLANHEWSQAVDVFKTLWNFFPDNLDYGICYARSLIRAGKAKEALATAEALSKLPGPKGEDPAISVVEAQASESISDFRRAQEAAARAAEKSEQRGARVSLANARAVQGNAFARLGEPEKAQKAFEEALQIFAATGKRASEAAVSSNIAFLLAGQGDLAGAKARNEEALAIFREVGHELRVPELMNNIGSLLRSQGDLDRAKRTHQQAIELCQNLDNKRCIASAQYYLGCDLEVEGNRAEAKRAFQESLKIARGLEDRFRSSRALDGLARLQLSEGDLAGAREAFQQLLAMHREMGDKSGLAGALQVLGVTLREQGDLAGARKSLEEAVAIRKQLGEKLESVPAELSLAGLAIDQGRVSEAEGLAQKAVEQFQAGTVPEIEAQARALLARSFLAQGEPIKAQEALARAAELARKSQSRSARFSVEIASAKVRASMRNVAEAKKSLKATLADAKKYGSISWELESRLALGEIEMKSGDSVAGRAYLKALEKDAKSHGFALIARQAVAASK